MTLHHLTRPVTADDIPESLKLFRSTVNARGITI